MEIAQQARSPREILARHGENKAGAFRVAGTRARERLSLPRRVIAVIAALFLAGFMSGDHGVKADGRRGARRHRWCVHGSTAGSGKLGIAATVAGTMAGLFPGGGISASLDNLYAARTRQAALETRPSGVPSRWHNPSTGNAGAITPTRTYKSAGGIYCKEYQLTVTPGGVARASPRQRLPPARPRVAGIELTPRSPGAAYSTREGRRSIQPSLHGPTAPAHRFQYVTKSESLSQRSVRAGYRRGGSVRRFVLGPFCQTLTNLSPKKTANCVLASNHSRGGRFHASAA